MHMPGRAAANVSVEVLQREISEGMRARSRIVESNVALVGSLVQQLKRSCGGRLDSGTTEADLVQEGCIALLRAAERFDVSVGVRFGTYATFWAKAAMRKALKEQTRVVRLPARVHYTYGKIKRASETLEARGERDAADGLVCEEKISSELASTGVTLSPEKIRAVVQQVKRRPSSLDVRLGTDSSSSAVDLVADSRRAANVEGEVVARMLQSDLSTVMRRHLREEEAAVLTLRFGLEDGEARTVRQVGEAMGMPYATAKHTLFQALNKMRRPHVAKALRDYLGDADSDECAALLG